MKVSEVKKAAGIRSARFLFLVASLAPASAWAGGACGPLGSYGIFGCSDTPMGYVLCVIALFVLGDMGRALATLAVIVVGVGASVGKVSWGLAITVAVGISVLFGADELLLALTGLDACVNIGWP